jgi:hypothetical protein
MVLFPPTVALTIVTGSASARRLRPPADRLNQRVDRFQYETLQLSAAVLPGGVDDAGDDVLSAVDLIVVGRRLRLRLAGIEIDEHHGHGGRSDVDGESVHRASVNIGPRPHGEQPGRAFRLAGRVVDQPDVPVRGAQDATQLSDLLQRCVQLLDSGLTSQSGRQPAPVVGLVVHRRWRETENGTPDCLQGGAIVSGRNGDIRSDVIGSKAPFDLLGRRNHNGDVALNHRLTGQRVACLDVGFCEAKGAAATNLSFHNAHGTPATTTLAAAGLADVDIGPTSRLHQQSTGTHGDWISTSFELDQVLCHGNPQVTFYPSAKTVFM